MALENFVLFAVWWNIEHKHNQTNHVTLQWKLIAWQIVKLIQQLKGSSAGGRGEEYFTCLFWRKKNLSFLLWGNRSFLFSYEFRNRQFWNWSSAIIPLFLACRQNRTEKSFYFSLHFVAAESKLLSSFTLWGVSTPLPKLMLASKRWRCLSSDWKMSHSYFYYFYI